MWFLLSLKAPQLVSHLTSDQCVHLLHLIKEWDYNLNLHWAVIGSSCGLMPICV